MDRIAIVGCGGSGKSHLARQLGALLAITPMHLDGLYYDRDWKPLDKEQFAAPQRDLVTAPRWIIDGNYATLPIRLQVADTVVFLDLPAGACLWRIVQRRLRHGGGQHDTVGVYDRITWNFIRYIAGLPSSPPRLGAGALAVNSGGAVTGAVTLTAVDALRVTRKGEPWWLAAGRPHGTAAARVARPDPGL